MQGPRNPGKTLYRCAVGTQVALGGGGFKAVLRIPASREAGTPCTHTSLWLTVTSLGASFTYLCVRLGFC